MNNDRILSWKQNYGQLKSDTIPKSCIKVVDRHLRFFIVPQKLVAVIVHR